MKTAGSVHSEPPATRAQTTFATVTTTAPITAHQSRRRFRADETMSEPYGGAPANGLADSGHGLGRTPFSTGGLARANQPSDARNAANPDIRVESLVPDLVLARAG